MGKNKFINIYWAASALLGVAVAVAGVYPTNLMFWAIAALFHGTIFLRSKVKND